MRKSLLIGVSLILVIVGLFIVFSSVVWGSEAANAYLSAQGGGMDGSQFMIVFQEYIAAYRWIGSIVAIISGFGVTKGIEVK